MADTDRNDGESTDNYRKLSGLPRLLWRTGDPRKALEEWRADTEGGGR